MHSERSRWPTGSRLGTTAKLANSQGSTSKARATRGLGAGLGRIDGHSMAGALLRWAASGATAGRVAGLAVALCLIVVGILMLPLEQLLKSFLIWLKQDMGFWGPFVMAAAYVPLTLVALPSSILTLGGGYLFGLPVGFAADSVGSTVGATIAFLIGKTVGRAYVVSKLREFPQFQAITTAISKSGFKIVLLLRLVPILPFSVLNYVLSVTPISLTSYVLASWIGTMPVTFAFVYIGTTIKDISEIGSPGSASSSAQWWLVAGGLAVTIFATIMVTRVAKDALQKAIEDSESSKEDHYDEEQPASLDKLETSMTGLDALQPRIPRIEGSGDESQPG